MQPDGCRLISFRKYPTQLAISKSEKGLWRCVLPSGAVSTNMAYLYSASRSNQKKEGGGEEAEGGPSGHVSSVLFQSYLAALVE